MSDRMGFAGYFHCVIRTTTAREWTIYGAVKKVTFNWEAVSKSQKSMGAAHFSVRQSSINEGYTHTKVCGTR